jgi:hypothetical protein
MRKPSLVHKTGVTGRVLSTISRILSEAKGGSDLAERDTRFPDWDYVPPNDQTTERLADVAGCHRILLSIPDRLGKSNEALSGIASIVARAAEDQSGQRARLARKCTASSG